MCEAKIDILIKKNNRNTRKNDDFLKHNPPLCGKITLSNEHNHTINTSGSLKYLRINPEAYNMKSKNYSILLNVAYILKYHKSMVIHNIFYYLLPIVFQCF